MTNPINMEEALSRMEGDRELLCEIAGLFLAQIPHLLSDLTQSLDRQDAGTLRRTAHSLKGSAGNLGASVVYATAARVEQLAVCEQVGIADAVRQLALEVDELRVALEELISAPAVSLA